MKERGSDQQARAWPRPRGGGYCGFRNYLLTPWSLGAETQQILRRCEEDDVLALRRQERGEGIQARPLGLTARLLR